MLPGIEEGCGMSHQHVLSCSTSPGDTADLKSDNKGYL